MLGLPAGGSQPQGEVLPAIRNANTALQTTLALLTQIESKTTSIASKINAAFGGGSMEKSWTQGSTGMGMPRPSFGQVGGSGGRGSIGGFGGTIIDGEVAGNRPATRASGMPVPAFGGGGVGVPGGLGRPGLPGGNVLSPIQGGGASGSGGSTLGMAARAGTTSFVGSAIGHVLSAQPGVVNDDLLYNSLRISGGGNMDFQRRTAPIGLNKAFSGGFTSHADLMGATSTLYGLGMNYQSMTGQFGSSLSTFARAGGIDLNSAAQMSATFAQPMNVALGRMYGIQMNDPHTGGAADPMTLANQLYNQIYHGQAPTRAQVDAGFAPGGSVYLALQSLGISDPGQVAAVRRMFEARAQTKMPLTAQSMKAAGLTNNLNATTRDRTASADLNQANQFNGQAGGIESANDAAKGLSDALHGATSALGDFTGGLRGFLGGIGSNPGSGGHNLFGGGISNAIGSVTNDLILAKLLKGGAGAAGGAGMLGRIGSAVGSRGLLSGLMDVGVAGGALSGGAGILGGLGGEWLGKKVGHPHLGGMAGGAAAGAGVGAIFGGVGAVPGALIGGALGGIASFFGGPDGQNHGFTMDPGTNLSGGGGGSTIPQILKMAQGLPFAYRVTSGFREGGSSYHARGEAVDFAGPKPEVDSATLLNINQYFANRYGAAMTELIYAGPGGITMKNGKRVSGSFYGAETMSEHHNHVHVAVDPAAAKLIHLGNGGDPAGLQTNSMNSSGGGLGGALSSIEASAMTTRGRAMLITDPNAPGLNLGGGGMSGAGAGAVASAHARTSGSSGSGAAPSAMPSGSLSSWERQALGILHLDYKTYAPGLTNLINHESSGNPHSINMWDSNAKAGHPSKGLMQTIDSTFQQYAVKGHTDIWNPVDNILAGVRYATANYGLDMIKGGGRRDAKGNYIGYATGSWAIPADHDARVHQGEMVLPARIAQAVRDTLGNGSANSGGHHAGCNVNLHVYPAKVDHAEAVRLASMVQDVLRRDEHLSAVGTS